MRLVYLATPYSSDTAKVRDRRRMAAAAVLTYYAYQAGDSTAVYSSIVHWGYAAEHFELPHEFDFWKGQDFFMVSRASAFWVLPLIGWRESYGVQQETEYAEDIGRPVSYVQVKIGKTPTLYLTEPGTPQDEVVTYIPAEIVDNVKIALHSTDAESTPVG